jgi:hypothetical protein
LKKILARKNRPFKPSNSSAFYIGAHRRSPWGRSNWVLGFIRHLNFAPVVSHGQNAIVPILAGQ